ncbi:MAG: zinc-ribbon domain-containing protein, partial [Deltaproteobacteria bacterium]|nr:zinc-ribbon domain-containing protein [Deltaproteobacteria bacterium]
MLRRPAHSWKSGSEQPGCFACLTLDVARLYSPLVLRRIHRRERRAEHFGVHAADAVRRPTVIVCPRCDKENQDHYKFCLGCGAELPRDAAKAPEGFTAPTPPAGVPIAAPPAPAQFGGAAAPAVPAPPQFGGAAAQSAPVAAPAPA